MMSAVWTLTCLACLAPGDGVVPRGLTVGPSGTLRAGDVDVRILHFAKGWQCATQGAETVFATPRQEADGAWRWAGQFATKLPGRSFDFQEVLRRVDARTVAYEATFAAAEPIATEQLALAFELPLHTYLNIPIQFGDETFVLPREPFRDAVARSNLTRLVVPTRAGLLTVEGAFAAQVQDGRNFASPTSFRLRVLFDPPGGDLRASKLALHLRLEPYREGEQPDFGAVSRSVITADETWIPVPHHVETVPGSALDWSTMLPAEPGPGRLVARDGHLEYEGAPGRRVRLYGTNLCDRANLLSHDEADRVAAQLRRMGYNAVRLHHYDRHLPRTGQPLSAGFDPERLDRFDYLFAALKRQGLAITIDLYTVRKVLRGEIAEVDRDVWLNEFKALCAISPTALENWKTFARLLLTHVNPYTKLAWKDDPALVSLCLLNEDNLTVHATTAPDIGALYRARFTAWQQARGAAPATPEEAPNAWARFLLELHQKLADEGTRTLRDLGVKALVTDANYRQETALGLLRSGFDLVDNHDYYDLKKTLGEPFTLPYGHHQRSAVREQARLPRSLFASRLFGQPYTVTEFNYCYPNHQRAEGGPLMGAYAALQDWDGLFRYAYGHSPEHAAAPARAFYLDTATDPLNLLSDRLGVLLYRRDVAPARAAFAYAFDRSVMDLPNPLDRVAGQAPEEVGLLGLFGRVGSVNTAAGQRPPADCRAVLARGGGAGRVDAGAGLLDRLAAAGHLPAGALDPTTARVVSDTGELRLDSAAGRFTVVTPRTECLVLPGGDAAGERLRVTGATGFAVVAVSALDGQPLATSRRLLVWHLTDVQNTKVQFAEPEHTTLEAWGELPHLVRAGQAALRIRFDDARPATIHALDLSGARRETVASQADGSNLAFTARIAKGSEPRLVYEVVR